MISHYLALYCDPNSPGFRYRILSGLRHEHLIPENTQYWPESFILTVGSGRLGIIELPIAFLIHITTLVIRRTADGARCCKRGKGMSSDEDDIGSFELVV